MKSNNNNNGNNRAKYNRNRSFGAATTPSSPTKKNSRGGGGGGKPQPTRRSVSHDAQTIKKQYHDASSSSLDDNSNDGFTSIGAKRNNKGPRKGRPNATSSFNRPRNTSSFSKPRPTGSFKKGRDNNNNNNSQSCLQNSSSSFDFSNNNNPNRGGNTGRTSSFNKPRPTNSFTNKHRDSNSSNNNGNARAKQAAYQRSVSRLTSQDVDLYQPGDGKTPAQRRVTRIHGDQFLQTRLQHLDPPSFGTYTPEDAATTTTATTTTMSSSSGRWSNLDTDRNDDWNPHHKCLWNDPTRREQIEKVMLQYPNAIPLHLRKRNRIKSSKLGDLSGGAAPAISSSSSILSSNGSIVDENDNHNDRDDLSLSGRSACEAPMANSSMVFVGSDQEDMNPLRKVLLLLNKLSWTTIDKLTPKLFEVLEQDVPNLMQSSLAPPSSIITAAAPNAEPEHPLKDGKDSNNNNKNNDDVSKIEQDNKNEDNTSDIKPTAATAAAGNSTNNDSKKAPAPASAELSPMVITILTLVVEKAQTEPHFSAMYAQMCKNLAERNKAWKRKMLALCQKEFEHDIAWHIARLDESLQNKSKAGATMMDDASTNTNASEEMDREYQVLQLRKRYFGHVQFLGELFKLNLIKLDILIWCLARLLFHKEVADDDDLECFAKLMTVAGEQADSMVRKGKCHALAEEKWYDCWDRVYFLTGRKKKKELSGKARQNDNSQGDDSKATPPKISSRIRFMLVDLLELEENGWVHRRQKEKPKTIAEIHEEVREEEMEARRRSFSDDWSFGSRRRANSDEYVPPSPQYHTKPQKNLDADGFIEVPTSKRTSIVRRAVSDVEVSDIYNKPSSLASMKPTPVPSSPASRSRTVLTQIDASNATPRIMEYPDPQECKDKTKTIMKEYFVGGDTKEAIISIDEIVGAGRDNEDHGSVDRGAAVIESGVLLVMEMKQQEVQKFLAVMKRCLQKKKLEKESIPLGLKDPLEFLSDIEIDAPLARSLLTSIVAYWVRQEVLPLNFLLDAPEYFRTDGKPAEFAAGVLKVRGGDPTEEDIALVEQLMTEGDKEKFSSPKDMLAPPQS